MLWGSSAGAFKGKRRDGFGLLELVGLGFLRFMVEVKPTPRELRIHSLIHTKLIRALEL